MEKIGKKLTKKFLQKNSSRKTMSVLINHTYFKSQYTVHIRNSYDTIVLREPYRTDYSHDFNDSSLIILLKAKVSPIPTVRGRICITPCSFFSNLNRIHKVRQLRLEQRNSLRTTIFNANTI